MSYWLLKSEPSAFGITDLIAAPNQITPWEGVRNYQARNFLRDGLQVGDQAFFYHSNEGKEIVGIVEIVKEHYPDPTDKTAKFVCVDIAADKPLKKPVPLEAIKTNEKLTEMDLVKYSRLSVQSVTPEQWKLVCKMGGI